MTRKRRLGFSRVNCENGIRPNLQPDQQKNGVRIRLGGFHKRTVLYRSSPHVSGFIHPSLKMLPNQAGRFINVTTNRTHHLWWSDEQCDPKSGCQMGPQLLIVENYLTFCLKHPLGGFDHFEPYPSFNFNSFNSSSGQHGLRTSKEFICELQKLCQTRGHKPQHIAAIFMWTPPKQQGIPWGNSAQFAGLAGDATCARQRGSALSASAMAHVEPWDYGFMDVYGRYISINGANESIWIIRIHWPEHK